MIALDEEYSGAFAYRGAAHLGLRELNEALADLDNALKLKKDDPYALRYRGIVNYKKGRYKEALADFKQVCVLGHSRPWIEKELDKLRRLIPQIDESDSSYSDDEYSGASVYCPGLGR